MGIIFILIVRPGTSKNFKSHVVLSYWASNKLLCKLYFWDKNLFCLLTSTFTILLLNLVREKHKIGKHESKN